MATAVNSYAPAISSYDSDAHISLNNIAEYILATMMQPSFSRSIHVADLEIDLTE